MVFLKNNRLIQKEKNCGFFSRQANYCMYCLKAEKVKM